MRVRAVRMDPCGRASVAGAEDPRRDADRRRARPQVAISGSGPNARARNSPRVSLWRIHTDRRHAPPGQIRDGAAACRAAGRREAVREHAAAVLHRRPGHPGEDPARQRERPGAAVCYQCLHPAARFARKQGGAVADLRHRDRAAVRRATGVAGVVTARRHRHRSLQHGELPPDGTQHDHLDRQAYPLRVRAARGSYCRHSGKRRLRRHQKDNGSGDGASKTTRIERSAYFAGAASRPARRRATSGAARVAAGRPLTSPCRSSACRYTESPRAASAAGISAPRAAARQPPCCARPSA
ncbi:hypothetical protein BME24068_01694 [Burkholderia metallica]|nr:hypothetical protein BME24068_01694 [Burkholderia metallica]